MSDDDDCPPPLSSLPEQLQALQIKGGVTSTSGSGDEQLPVASTTAGPHPQGQGSGRAPVTLKKGFFDAKPKAKPKQQQLKDSQYEAPDIPLIKARKDGLTGSGPHIPDFLRLAPDEQEQKYHQMKQQLVDALKPTPDNVADIAKDPTLMAGFDDAEVMAAVNDIAQNPQNIKKYQHNKKVQQFYSAMGKMMGQKLENMQQPTQAR